MRILVTNDDGYATNGIKAIAGLLSKFGKVTIVAPRMAQSGKSASLSLEDPLRMEYAGRTDGIETYFCNGTPADCVKLAMNTVFLDEKPDLLVSGINHGSNASVASIYSGTLGAAMEGTLYDVPSLGFSICSHDHEADLSGVLEYGEKIIRKVIESPMKKDVFMNINFPDCPAGRQAQSRSLADALGAKAFTLFRDRSMAVFFIFSMLLGVALQITNGFANPFITHFTDVPEYADTWGARNANALISISQMSETLGILLIPVALKFFGIKRVMLIAMLAWVFRFGLFGLGNPGPGVWMFILSMIVYGVAFDFFNISGALYVEQRSSDEIKSSAQGLFMLMTNGIGATVGTLSAQAVVNHFVYNAAQPDWSTAWYIFAGYALLVAVLFAIFFRDPGKGPYKKIA